MKTIHILFKFQGNQIETIWLPKENLIQHEFYKGYDNSSKITRPLFLLANNLLFLQDFSK
jgi:hypothetical protein